jgi:glycosyltransferase involved in cell wall biosynthesis
MIRVLLVNQNKIPHYRIPIYGYLAKYLSIYGFDLIVCSEGLQENNPHPVQFKFAEMPLSVLNISKCVAKNGIDIVIVWVNLRNAYLLPVCVLLKFILRKNIIYWGHGRDLADRDARIKNLGYMLQQTLSDALVLYAEHLRKYVPKRFHRKTFVANNTLFMNYAGLPRENKQVVLNKYGIHTKKNIICVGRMQKRKRLENLFAAFCLMDRDDIGLILVGPDPDGLLKQINGKNIYKLGAIYDERKYDLLSASEIFCLPGAVGLSIVDAFYCGLPLVTEEGDESPELCYLKNGVNGFIVPKNDIDELRRKLEILLEKDTVRKEFSAAAKKEIRENASIELFSAGFRDALVFVAKKGEKHGQ